MALTRLIRLSAMCPTDPAARFDAVAAEALTGAGISTILSLGFGNAVLTHEPGKACQKRPTQKIFSIKGLVTRQCF